MIDNGKPPWLDQPFWVAAQIRNTNLRQWVQSAKWSTSKNKPCWKHHHAPESTSLPGSEEYSMNWPIVLTLTCLRKLHVILMDGSGYQQGCINCAILLSGIGARGVSWEHMENMEIFSCSPTLIGALWFSENLISYSLHACLREVKNNLFSFKHSYIRHFSWRF